MAVVRDCGKARSTSYPGPVQLQSDLAMLDGREMDASLAH